ncbi:hypothetical protein V1280_000473 [Bradyrhizobium sp. AZCC 2230]
MYDVYLNRRNELLVMPRGVPIPASLQAGWGRRRRSVRIVSKAICGDVETIGYHRRNLGHHGDLGVTAGT